MPQSNFDSLPRMEKRFLVHVWSGLVWDWRLFPAAITVLEAQRWKHTPSVRSMFLLI